MSTVRLTVAQAAVRFLAHQYTERDGVQQRFINGCWGILGHGNLAGLGQALLEAELADPSVMPYFQGRNEQAMVHASVAYARASNRLRAMACTSSVGPGATNMVTGAALATINRLPVLLLPGDVFATRTATPVLQELEHTQANDISVNDSFRPVSKFFARVSRPEQLPDALRGAMRVLTDPVDTGAATIALPEDVQTEAWEWPARLFSKRIWHVPRQPADQAAVERAAVLMRSAQKPLIIAGGGVIYSEATDALREFAEATGIPVAVTQAGKGAMRYDHPACVGAIGATGTVAANALAREADLVIGIGTRYSDFTTASRSAFGNPHVRFVNVNIARFDSIKHAAVSVVADAREALGQLAAALDGWWTPAGHSARAADLAREWDETVAHVYQLAHTPLPAQSEVIGAVNEAAGERDVVVCAAGSMPGDLHKLWRSRDPLGYHVEYGYSCMGYEIAGGIGVKLACPDREVFVLVGDGSYLMMAQEIVTALQERIKITVVLVENHGYASIGALSESVGAPRFGTQYRYRDPSTRRLTGEILPVDLAANAESLGATVIRARSIADLRGALAEAKVHTGGPIVIHIEVDPTVSTPSSESWWDVPVAEVSTLDATRSARAQYESDRAAQRPYL